MINIKNAVLYKDMIVNAKRKRLAIDLFILNLILAVGTLIFLAVINIQLVSGFSTPANIFTYAFNIIVIFECAVVSLSAPNHTAPAIANEREQQTLNVLLTSGLSYTNIIFGKFMSACLYIFMVLLSALPFMAIVFAYGGVSFGQIFLMLISMMFISMYMCSIGIHQSVRAKKATKASAKTLLILFMLIIGLPIMALIVTGIASWYKYAVYPLGNTPKIVWFEYFDFLLYFCPATTMIDILDRVVGFNFSYANTKGMSYIVSNLTTIPANHFMLRFWTPLSILCQSAVSVFALYRASKEIDPTRKRKYRVGKNKHNSEN